MDAAESLPDMLWSSLLWPSASYGTEPCMPADCAATFASRRVQVVCLPLWKLNHEFQWLAIDTDMDGAAMGAPRRSTNSVGLRLGFQRRPKKQETIPRRGDLM